MKRTSNSQIPNLENYISKQKYLIKREYELETEEKQKTKIDKLDLFFKLCSRYSSQKLKTWTTKIPLPKNLIAPEYLIITDPIYVNISDKIKIDILDKTKETIEGEVIQIRDGELIASFKLNWDGINARHICSIEFLPNDIVFKRKMEALKKLYNLNINLKNMLCHKYPKEQKIPRIKLNIPKNYNFNDSQKRAIIMAVSNPFSLIQGPPGTGKTHTIGAIAIQALTNEPNKKVLICGTTNVSINSLLEIVGDMVQSSGYKVCWPASSYRDFKSEENLTKEQKLMTLYISRHMDSIESKRFKELSEKRYLNDYEDREMKKLRDLLEQKVIKESNVVFSTLDSSGKSSIVKNIGQISTLIVDEATLSVESSMIIPLSLLPDRFVLVGDQKQLGPQPSFTELRKEGYYYSMFERIIKEKSCLKNSVMLNVQYRMHPIISALPNRLFYDMELIDGVRPDERIISSKFSMQKHFNFININGVEEKNGTSYINTEEICNVVKFVNSLIESGVHPSQIGVISAYGAQTHVISENFKTDGIRVKVSTIDSFQGSQKDYIIICTTRNGSNLGFLTDERRMNVAITRARCLVAIFGNEKTLSQSNAWNEVIKYAKDNKSFHSKLPIIIGKTKFNHLIISKNTGNVERIMVSEFKENEHEAGYHLREIRSNISNSIVRILWPDEEKDIEYLKDWVQKRINKLKKLHNHITIAYDAESVCMQFGDIFDEKIDYYNFDNSIDIPKIKTNESIIISFYQHNGNHNFDTKLVNIMKPLLEHPRITLITFDFTYDFDLFVDFGINIKTKQIIDTQLSILPDDEFFDEYKSDFICSTGWKPISSFILRAIENNVNDQIISNAKEYIHDFKKKSFPHEENSFLIEQFNYPKICHFTKEFLEYSANDIFYTAIVGIDVLSRGEIENVKERSLKKFNSFINHRKKYGSVRAVRDANYVSESFTSAYQFQFSKENNINEILSIYKKINSFVKYPEIYQEIIPDFDADDIIKFKKRYNDILDIMKNTDIEHLGNIKDKAILSYVEGIKKIPSFVLRVKEEIQEQPDTEPESKSFKENKVTQENKIVQENNTIQENVEHKIDTVNKKKRKRKSKKKKKNRFVYTPGE